MSSELDQTVWNEKSVQEVSKQKARLGHFSTASKDGYALLAAGGVPADLQPERGVRKTGEYAVKIQHAGKRETFALGTSNKTAAAAKAKEIYLSLRAAGWGGTLAKFKPKASAASRCCNRGRVSGRG